jgi:hypothetical protein
MNALHDERTISRNDRAGQSIIDRMHIIEAIEPHNTELAEQPVRRRVLILAL